MAFLDGAPGHRIIAERLDAVEGPIARADGSVVVVTTSGLVEVEPSGDTNLIADLGVGANGAAEMTGGDIVVAHNGGVGRVGKRPGSVLAVRSTGLVDVLADGLETPNDIVVGGSGAVIFTDPCENWFGDERRPGVVLRIDGTGSPVPVMEGLEYPNGVGLHADGSLVVAESRTGWLWRGPESGPLVRWIRVQSGAPDGFAFHPDGRLFVCCFDEHRIDVFDEAAVLADSWYTGEDTWPTNCAVSTDGTGLFWTDSLGGRLLRAPV